LKGIYNGGKNPLEGRRNKENPSRGQHHNRMSHKIKEIL